MTQPHPPSNCTILLFGHTGSGKTAQLGELAEWVYKKTGKFTRLYTADLGGWETIRPYVELGIIKIVPLSGDVWVWINHAVKGDKFNAEKQVWEPGIDADIGMYAYEGMTSFSSAAMSWMAEASGRGVNIGGGGSFTFVAGQGKEALKIGSNNVAHYGVAQQQVYEKSTQSQYLPGIVLWTAGDSRGEDDVTGGVVGPQLAGKAKTGEVPQWFKYTFRLACEMQVGEAPKHVLYTDHHIELASKGMAKAIANSRAPMAGSVAIPPRIEPASLVAVLELLEQRQKSAKDEIKARLGLA